MNKQPVNAVTLQEIEALVGTLEKLQSVAHKIITCSDREFKKIENEFRLLLANSNSCSQDQCREQNQQLDQ